MRSFMSMPLIFLQTVSIFAQLSSLVRVQIPLNMILISPQREIMSISSRALKPALAADWKKEDAISITLPSNSLFQAKIRQRHLKKNIKTEF